MNTFLDYNSFRRARRTPTARAEPLSTETPEETAGPRERAIKADESALMWSALEDIPEIYRELPMLSAFDALNIILLIALVMFHYWRWQDGRTDQSG